MLPVVAAIALVATLAACKKEDNKKPDDTGNQYDRGAMLTNYADNYIVPAYGAMNLTLEELKTATTAFINAPNLANLYAARESWRTAYLLWQQVDLLEFGPAEDVSLRMYMNTYPTTVSKIDANITAGSYNLEEFGNKDAQGFAALDYLLNGIDNTNSGVITQYTTDAQATARKQYLNDVVNKMLAKVQGVKNAWGSYRNTFVEATGTDVNSSLSKMANAYVLYYERYLRSGKIGLPAGAMTGVAKADISEAYYTPELGKELALAALNATLHYYRGMSFASNAEGQGMKDYFAAIATKDDQGNLLADVTDEQLNEAITALQALNTTIIDGVTNNRPQVLGIYEQMQEVVPLLKVDMISAFGISITYVDNDGD